MKIELLHLLLALCGVASIVICFFFLSRHQLKQLSQQAELYSENIINELSMLKIGQTQITQKIDNLKQQEKEWNEGLFEKISYISDEIKSELQNKSNTLYKNSKKQYEQNQENIVSITNELSKQINRDLKNTLNFISIKISEHSESLELAIKASETSINHMANTHSETTLKKIENEELVTRSQSLQAAQSYKKQIILYINSQLQPLENRMTDNLDSGFTAIRAQGLQHQLQLQETLLSSKQQAIAALDEKLQLLDSQFTHNMDTGFRALNDQAVQIQEVIQSSEQQVITALDDKLQPFESRITSDVNAGFRTANDRSVQQQTQLQKVIQNSEQQITTALNENLQPLESRITNDMNTGFKAIGDQAIQLQEVVQSSEQQVITALDEKLQPLESRISDELESGFNKLDSGLKAAKNQATQEQAQLQTAIQSSEQQVTTALDEKLKPLERRISDELVSGFNKLDSGLKAANGQTTQQQAELQAAIQNSAQQVTTALDEKLQPLESHISDELESGFNKLDSGLQATNDQITQQQAELQAAIQSSEQQVTTALDGKLQPLESRISDEFASGLNKLDSDLHAANDQATQQHAKLQAAIQSSEQQVTTALDDRLQPLANQISDKLVSGFNELDSGLKAVRAISDQAAQQQVELQAAIQSSEQRVTTALGEKLQPLQNQISSELESGFNKLDSGLRTANDRTTQQQAELQATIQSSEQQVTKTLDKKLQPLENRISHKLESGLKAVRAVSDQAVQQQTLLQDAIQHSEQQIATALDEKLQPLENRISNELASNLETTNNQVVQLQTKLQDAILDSEQFITTTLDEKLQPAANQISSELESVLKHLVQQVLQDEPQEHQVQEIVDKISTVVTSQNINNLTDLSDTLADKKELKLELGEMTKYFQGMNLLKIEDHSTGLVTEFFYEDGLKVRSESRDGDTIKYMMNYGSDGKLVKGEEYGDNGEVIFEYHYDQAGEVSKRIEYNDNKIVSEEIF